MRRFTTLLFFPLLLAAADEPYRDPGLGKITQIAILCKDIDACAARWGKLLNQPVRPVITTEPGREVDVIYRGKPSDGQAKLAFFRSGDMNIELIEPVGPDTFWREELDKNGEGFNHIGFRVEEFERAIESFAQQGMPVIHRGRFDGGQYAYIDSKEQLGVVIELVGSLPRQGKE